VFISLIWLVCILDWQWGNYAISLLTNVCTAVPSCSFAVVSRLPNMKSIISLHLGAAGLGLAPSMWDLLTTELQAEEVSRAFSEDSKGTRHPRALLVDLDFDHKAAILRNPLLSQVPYIATVQGTGGYSMNAHYCIGKEIVDECLNGVRRSMEEADSVDGLVMLSSLNGGTGSGFTNLLLDRSEIMDIRSKMYILVLPTCDSVVEPYNFVLTASNLAEKNDLIVCYDNKDTGKVALSMGMEGGLAGVNSVIAQSLSHLYSQKDDFPRSIGALASSVARESLKFVVPSVSLGLGNGFNPETDVTRLEAALSQGCCCAHTAKPSPQSCYLQFRGDWSLASAHDYLGRSSRSCDFSLYSHARPQWRDWQAQSHSLLQLQAEPSFKLRLQRIARNFDQLYSKRSHVHWYMGLGMSEGEFGYAREEFARLIKAIEYGGLTGLQN